MNSYEAKLERRRERLEARAEKARAESARLHQHSHALVEHIPMGQPVLVGHHSEKRHRRTLDRSWNALGKAVAASEKADRLEARAAAVGSAGISSDDPDSIDKLKEKLAKLEDKQNRMREANKAVRKGDDARLRELGFTSDAMIAAFKAPDFMGRVGFAGYELTNNNANIRRIRERIAHLERRQAEAAKVEAETGEAQREHEAPNGVRIVENFEANRLQIFFPGKPSDEIRTQLKQAGFRWSRWEGAWQRHLGNSALWHAQRITGATS